MEIGGDVRRKVGVAVDLLADILDINNGQLKGNAPVMVFFGERGWNVCVDEMVSYPMHERYNMVDRQEEKRGRIKKR